MIVMKHQVISLFPLLQLLLVAVVLHQQPGQALKLIYEPPTFYSALPRFKEVLAGDSLHITCTVGGSPSPQVYWTKDGEVVAEYVILNLTNVQESANYSCNATNELGTISAQTEVRVIARTGSPPTVPLHVRARAHNRTTALVEWDEPSQLNGELKEYEVSNSLCNGQGTTIELWKSERSVTISMLTEKETYCVTVQARTNHGNGPKSHSFQFVMIPGAPSTPKNVQVINSTAASITLTWDRPDIHETLLSYEIYINNTRTHQREVRSVIPATEDYIVQNLYPNTIYNIRITARSVSGEGPHTKTLQTKTNEAEPSGPPIEIAVVASSDLSISTVLEVRWQPPSAEAANGIITGYKVYYKPTNDGSGDSPRMKVINGGQQLNTSIENLDVYSTYKVWMTARTTVGYGPESPPVIARTGQSVPGAPKNVTVRALNSSAVFVSWRKPNEREANGEIRGYQLFQSQVDDNIVRVETAIMTMINMDAQNYTVTGLHAETSYCFSITAFTVAGDGNASSLLFIKTLKPVPTAPTALRLQLIEEDPIRIDVSWDEPLSSYGSIQSYRLIYGRRNFPSTEMITETTNSQRTRYAVYNLLKGTDYEFKVQARNEQGFGIAAVEHYRTEDGVPSGIPQNITITYQNSMSAIVSWAPPLERYRNGIITMYQVRYQDKADAINLRADNTSETSLLLVNLTAGSKYYIQVVAFTSAGAGPLSYKELYNTIQTKPSAPTDVQGERIEPTVINIRWIPPPLPVIGYKIYYHKIEDGVYMDDWQSVLVDQPLTTYTLTNLDARTAYTIQVQGIGMENDAGSLSESAFIDISIDESKRNERVQNLECTKRTATSLTIKWKLPEHLRAAKYKIKFKGISLETHKRHRPHGKSPIILDVNGQHLTEYTRENLKPYHKYTIDLSVQYLGQDRFSSTEIIQVDTKSVATPKLKANVASPVIVFSRDDDNFDNVYVIVAPASYNAEPSYITMQKAKRYRRETKFADAITDSPYIAAEFPGAQMPGEFTVGDGKEYGDFTNRELYAGFQYKAFVRAVINGNEFFSSAYSLPFTSAGPVADAVFNQSEQPSMVSIIGPAAGGLVVVIIFVTVIMIIIRRRKKQKKEDAPPPTIVDIDLSLVYPTDPVDMRRQNFSTSGMQSHPSIPLTQLANHIDSLRANDNLKFSKEYESIEPGQLFAWDNSSLECNKSKNRYAHVIAYDHSRVVLQQSDGSLGSDYINANYMDGYRKQNAYISTQGPLPETFGDFWRMVWEQQTSTIVMMTKLEERARIKCDQYWPTEGTEMYGPIIVTLTDCMELSTYTVRTFQIERNGWSENREIRQFQFTSWPDHGVPDYPTPLLTFMRRVKAVTPSGSGPTIVHCSAGVGRTGAFIVIDAMLERIKHEKTVDIYGYVTCLRSQRNYMVQTEDQYIFIHDALLEAVQSGNTEISARNLYTHIQKLTQLEYDGPITCMESEFKKLTVVKSHSSRLISASLPVNKFKNRSVSILPFENNRVCLQPIRGMDGSDYINASFVDGYRFRKTFIATQEPLSETVKDFWRMLWEQKSTIVVMLSNHKETGCENYRTYWPSEHSARYQYFVVDPHAEYNMIEYTLREFKVTDARDGQSRVIRLFQFKEWPDIGVPKSGISFIQFIGQVHKTREQFDQEGPITVHCRSGAGRTGVFITLSIVLERMRYEGVVDMFQTVKMLRTQRQGMVQTQDQYAFCYQAALEHLASFDHY